MSFYYVFCEHCKKICKIQDHEGFDICICKEHGEVEGVKIFCLCFGCENFDEMYPFSIKHIDGCCNHYWGFSFKMFKRKNKCKHFQQRWD